MTNCKEALEYYSSNSIQIRNINLGNLTLVDEMNKDDEERKEFFEALITYLYDRKEESKEHLLEETCDRIQVLFSALKTIGIESEELAVYWNSKHLEKIKNRPRDKK